MELLLCPVGAAWVSTAKQQPSHLETQQAMSGNGLEGGCASLRRLSKFGQFKSGMLKVSFGKKLFQRTEIRNHTPT